MKIFTRILISLSLALSSIVYSAEFRVVSYNVRNYNPGDQKAADPNTDNKELFQILKSAEASLIGVQEIVHKEEFITFIKSNFPFYDVALSECGGRGRQHLGFVFDTRVLKLLKFKEDGRINPTGEGCTSLRPLAIGLFQHSASKSQFTAISLHLKAGGKPENIVIREKQMSLLTNVVKEFYQAKHNKVIVMGDFNSTEYMERGVGYQKFVNFTKASALENVTKDIACTSYWWGGVNDGLEHPSVLDHIMVSKEMQSGFTRVSAAVGTHCQKVRCQKAEPESLGRSYEAVSDHCPVMARFEF